MLVSRAWAIGLALVFIVLIATLVVRTLPATTHVPGMSLTGFGTATIDEVLSPGKWE